MQAHVLVRGSMALAVVGWLVLLFSATSHAAVLRYAVIVGNDHGIDGNGAARPVLQHAREDARRLRAALVKHSGFDDGPRTLVIEDATRTKLLAVLGTIRERMLADRAQLPDAKILFAFFYSGHGVDGSLLLADGPLGAAELAQALDRLPTDMRIGSFDACHSASLARTALSAKGMTPIPEFHLSTALPDATLNAEGSVWFFSSKDDELSFEDSELGGLFTHFFIEALQRAAPSVASGGVTVSLDAIWSYARQSTVDYARQRGRLQTPTKVQRTKETSPIVFAWRHRAPTRLVFDPAIEGKVLLYYAADVLMTFDKPRGRSLERNVYPGAVELVIVGAEHEVSWRQRLDLPAGATIHVGKVAPRDDAGLGNAYRRFSPKGDVRAPELHIERDALSLALGVGYRGDLGADVVLAPTHHVQLALRFDHGPWTWTLAGTYGADQRRFETWAYTLSATGLALSFGRTFTLGPTRLALGLGGDLAFAAQRFDDGTERRAMAFDLKAGTNLAWPVAFGMSLVTTVDIGARHAPGVGADAPARWDPLVAFGVGLVVRLL